VCERGLNQCNHDAKHRQHDIQLGCEHPHLPRAVVLTRLAKR
jgi:hypothetical protein